jgi:hypothetical protein
VYVVPAGFRLASTQLEALRFGAWDRLAAWPGGLPTLRFQPVDPDPAWPSGIQLRFHREQARTRERLGKLDRRLHREAAAAQVGGDPERLRQALFPFGLPQERVLPGLDWLRNGALLDGILAGMEHGASALLVEEP